MTDDTKDGSHLEDHDIQFREFARVFTADDIIASAAQAEHEFKAPSIRPQPNRRPAMDKGKDVTGYSPYRMEKFLEITGKKEVIAKRQAQAKAQLRPGCTEEELRKAQCTIREKMTDKFKRLDRAFVWIDKERIKSGGVLTKDELAFALHALNLGVGEVIPGPVFETLWDFMDSDDSGDIGYTEFARVLSANDIINMAPIQEFTMQEQIGGKMTKSDLGQR